MATPEAVFTATTASAAAQPQSPAWSVVAAGIMDNNNINTSNNNKKKKWPRAIVLGQFIAMLSATSNAASFTLVNRFDFQAPFFLLFLLYTLLSLHFFRRKQRCNHDDDTNHHVDEEPVVSSSLAIKDESESFPPRIIPSTSTTTIERRRLPRFCCCFFSTTMNHLNLKCPLYMYFLISLLDVMPNFLVLLALQYTSLTSITLLLGSLAVPSTMFFSSFLLSRYFTRQHYLGVCLCVVGGMLAVGLDSTPTETPTTTSTSTATTLHFASDDSTTTTVDEYSLFFASLNMGDLLMCTAALLYGLGDTVAEYFVKHLDRNEYLGMLGMFGMVQTSILCLWLKRNALKNSAWMMATTTTTVTMMMQQQQQQQPLPQQASFGGDEQHVIAHQSIAIVGPINNNSSSNSNETRWFMLATLLWFVTCQYLYYVMEVHFLTTSDATLLNLSMQTANLWAILFSIIIRHALPSPLFYVALVLVVCGVVLYEMDGTKIMTTTTQLQEPPSPRQGRLEKQTCRKCFRANGKDFDDDDESGCNHHNDDSLSENKALEPDTIRHNDYQSCRIYKKHNMDTIARGFFDDSNFV